MSRAHPDIGPELRRLAQTILDGLDPAVRSAAALAAGAGLTGEGATGKCQQVWCPVCALAALATGEQHPLLTVVADHSVTLLEAIRAMVNDVTDIDGPVKPPPDGPPGGGQTSAESPAVAGRNGADKTRYEAIPITVEE